MRFVLDNSVTMRWFFEDGGRTDLAYATEVLAELKNSTAVVPVTCGLEVANVLARAEASSRLALADSSRFIEMLQGLDIKPDEDTFAYALADTLDLARRFKLSAYDASYLELALRLNVPLATLDKSLRRAASRAGVERMAA